MKNFITIIFILSLTSCSHLSDNFIGQDSFYLRGGVSAHRKWNDHLIFKRTSWYHEVNLLFDVFLAEVDLKSPFSLWPSENEKESLRRCLQSFYVLNYSLDANLASPQELISQFEKQGFSILQVPQFKKSLQLHPDFVSNSLHLYKVYAICLKDGPHKTSLDVSLPSFPAIDLLRPTGH